MSTGLYILGGIQLAVSVLLIVAVLFQSGRSASINGSIAGGSDTFFSKIKDRSKEAVIAKITTVLAVVFVILTIAILFVSK